MGRSEGERGVREAGRTESGVRGLDDVRGADAAVHLLPGQRAAEGDRPKGGVQAFAFCAGVYVCIGV